MNDSAPELSACPLCSSESMRLLYDSIVRMDRSYDVYQCNVCGLAVTSPFPEKQRLATLYSPSRYRAHDKRFIAPVESMIRRFNAARLNRVRRFCRKGRILDIGCARGLILKAAQDEGWEAFGLEFSEETAAHARDALGLDVRTGDLREAGFERNSFDAITLWHVLEHMEDPFSVMEESFSLLKPGGVLAVSLPDIASWQSVLAGRHWFHLDLPYHLHHFSTKSLSMLLEKNSFRIVSKRHYSFEQNPFGYVQSLFNMTGMRYNYLYDMLKTSELRKELAGSAYLREQLLTALLLPLNLPVSLLMSFIEAAAGRGGTVEICARKA